MKNKIKAVLFDMDGVLIDAKDWHYEALNKALSHFGIEINRWDHLTTFDGLPTKVKLEIISKRYYLPACLHNFINELKQSYTEEIVYSRCHPMFHHEYALSKLKSEGYRLAVCSNSIRNTIEIMMKRSGLIDYIDMIVSNEDVKRAKPDPEMYETAIRKFALKPQECIVVEDNPNGIRAALSSGANVLEVDTVYDVTYERIKKKILECEND